MIRLVLFVLMLWIYLAYCKNYKFGYSVFEIIKSYAASLCKKIFGIIINNRRGNLVQFSKMIL